MTERIRVLFVDDEPNVLQGLRRSLRGQRSLWDMSFCASPLEALETLEVGPPLDVVVTDMQMPEMSGAYFLAQVMQRQPMTVRFILSGHTSGERLLQSSTVAHQFLSKPCDPRLLETLVNRACALRHNLCAAALNQKLLKTGSIPSVPKVYHEILKMMQAGEPDLSAVGHLIKQDIGLSTKVLQVVNSAFMGLRRHVSDIVHAASLLGLDNLRRIVLMAEVFTPDEEQKVSRHINLDALWAHSMQVAEYARAIAEDCTSSKQLRSDTFTAALLHEIGRIVLASQLQEEFGRAHDLAVGGDLTLLQAERQALGSTHAEVGGYLLELWGLPEPVVEAVTYYSLPSRVPDEFYGLDGATPDFAPLTALHVACHLAASATSGGNTHVEDMPLDTTYMERVGLLDRVEHWFHVCSG